MTVVRLAAVRLGDDLGQHGDDILKALATVTTVMINLTAFLHRNTSDHSPRDYLLMICIHIPVVLFVVFECVGHVRHRKQLVTRRSVR